MKTTSLLILAAALTISQAAGADAFKCQVDGHTVYQSHPCALESPDAGKVKIKAPSAEQEAAAQQKREAIEQDRREYNLNQAEIARKYSEAASQAETERMNAITRQQQAEAAQRESEARAKYWETQSGMDPTSRLSR